MRDSFVIVALLVLTAISLLNLVLVLRLIAIVRPDRPDVGLPAGTRLPGVGGIEDTWALPAAIVFLSRGCPACREATPMVETALADAHRAGLDLKVFVDGNEGNETVWLGPMLDDRAIRLTRRDYRRFNPHGAVPSYLFVDDAGLVQASGYIGDEDWQALTKQLREG